MELIIALEKNKCYPATVIAQGIGGEGICKIDGFTIFVAGGVVGDELIVKIVKLNRSYGYGRIEKIVSPSPYRVEAACPSFKRCGGCQLMHIDYEKQLEIKHLYVKDAIERIGGLDGECVLNTIGMDKPWRYRNKMQFPVGYDRNKNVVSGFFAERTHEIIAVEDCLVGSEAAAKITAAVKCYMKNCGVKPYEEESHTGIIRNVFIRTAAHSGSIMVVIVANAVNLPCEEELIKMLTETSDKIVSIVHNINTEKTNLVLGKHSVTIWGDDKLTDKLGGFSFEISPSSFYQINPVQTEILYGKAVEFADLDGTQTVFDLYCGAGTISSFMAKKAKKVIGIEIVPDAVKDAIYNAEKNGIDNMHFYQGDVGKVVRELYSFGERADVVCLDPPRKGADDATKNTVLEMNPERIVYVSCNPATLARDVKYFCDSGKYTLSVVQPVDMFCHTVHVESVALLTLSTTKFA